MLLVTAPQLLPFIALNGVINAASYYRWLHSTGDQFIQLIAAESALHISKFKPHSYAVRGRGTFFLNR